jgi:hypothetical protein
MAIVKENLGMEIGGVKGQKTRLRVGPELKVDTTQPKNMSRQDPPSPPPNPPPSPSRTVFFDDGYSA